MPAITLYTHPQSRGMNVLWMLEACDAAYDVVLVPYGAPMKSADYLAVNPMGKVPALKMDGHIYTETAAILTVLAEAFPACALIPAAATPARGDYYRWLCFALHLEYAAFDRHFHCEDAPARRRSLGYGDFDTAFATLRAHLAAHDYIVGDALSALDLYYCGLLAHFTYGQYVVLPADDAVFAAYIARITALPSYARAMEKSAALLAQMDA